VAGVVAAALGGCAAPTSPPAPVVVIYPAGAPGWPRPPATARIGDGLARAAPPSVPIVARAGVAEGPLFGASLVGSSDGPPEVAVLGHDVHGPAIDLIDIDAGVVRWRVRAAGLPVVAIVGSRVYAAGGDRVLALDRATGAIRATLAARWLGGAGVRPLVAIGDTLAILDDDAARARFTPPVGAAAAAVVAACGAGPSWVVAWQDGQLARWDLTGDRAVAVWSVASDQPRRVACDDERALVVVGGGAAVARDPATGAPRGPTVAAADAWVDPRDRDRVELATASGIERRDRELVHVDGVVPVSAVRLAAAHGARRIVIGVDGDPVLLDGDRVWVLAAPAGEPVMVAGARAVVAARWRWPRVSLGQTVTRYAWPDEPASAPRLTPPPVAALVPPPPRVDVPAAAALEVALTAEVGAWAVPAALLDPDGAERLYAVTLEARPDLDRGAGLVAIDLHSDRVRWTSPTGCPPGQPIALAAAAGRVACAARGVGLGVGAVAAVDAEDGRLVWRWTGATVDAVIGAGPVFAIIAGPELIVVDAVTGAVATRWRTTDGYLPRVAILRGDDDDDVALASYEHGAIVVRARRLGWRPVAAIAVDGGLVGLATVGDRGLATLADGSAYLFDRAGVAVAAGVLAASRLPRGAHLVAVTTTAEGDAAIALVDRDGVVRAEAALAGQRIATVGQRGPAPDAPLVVVTADREAVAFGADGRVLGRAALPSPDAPTFATVIDGRPVAGAVLAGPLRLAYAVR
jgi:hypothetical protein